MRVFGALLTLMTPKINFFKTKPCIADPYDRKLDLVPYFAPLVAFDVETKIEKQFNFSMGRPNAFFKLGMQPKSKKMILKSKFRFFENF